MAATSGLAVTGLVLVLGAVVNAASSGAPPAAAEEGPPGPAPPDQLKATSEDHHYAEPNYHYRYAVASRKTGDVKGAWEKRSGDDVWGAYFLRDPDGHWRTVHYEADSSGFYATVQRRPLYGHKDKLQPGELTDADQHLDLEKGAEQGAELDEAAWQDALLAAKESANEDNHPVLQKAKEISSSPEETAAEPYQLDEAPSERAYRTTTRRPAPNPGQPAVDKRSYTPRPRLVYYADPQASSTHRPTSYSSPPSQYFTGETLRDQDDEDAPYDSGSAASYARQPQGEGVYNAPYASASAAYSTGPSGDGVSYTSTTGRPQQPDDGSSYDESSSNYAEQPSGEGSSQSGSSAAYTERPYDEDSNSNTAQYERPTERPAKSEQYRVSEDLRQQDDDTSDRYQPNTYGGSDDKEQQEGQDEDDRGEADDKENEHNPDDDHEPVPEHALRGGGQEQQLHRQQLQMQQLAQLHSAHLQQAQLRVPPQMSQAVLVHEHHDGPQAPAPPQHSAMMEQLLGPAWSEVASHSKLFEGNDWPGLDTRPAEVAAEDSKDVPTWVKKERAKARRAQQAQALGQGGRAPPAERERGPGRYSGYSSGYSGAAPLTAARLTVARQPSPLQDTTPSAVDDLLPATPRPTADWGPQWSFGSKSKVRGKEDGSYPTATVAPVQQQAQQALQQHGHKRGATKGHNRGPVLFGQSGGQPLHLSASTPAGDRRAPPKGYVPPPAAWAHAKTPGRQQLQQQQRSVSYAGWVPVTASLQVQPLLAPSFGEKKNQADGLLSGRRGRSRGTAAAGSGLFAAPGQEQVGAGASAWRQWK